MGHQPGVFRFTQTAAYLDNVFISSLHMGGDSVLNDGQRGQSLLAVFDAGYFHFLVLHVSGSPFIVV